MSVIVIGLGSMGRRRIRILKRISPESIIIGVDNRQDRCEQVGMEFGVQTCTDLDDALQEFEPECAIVSTSPLSHAQIIEKCLLNGCHVFTEINLVSDGYDSNTSLADKMGKVLFLSSTFLYRDEIRYIRDEIKKNVGPVTYNYHVGQYLPDWHPWESVEDFFVGDSRTNGCRELFAIELPWIIKTFGGIKDYCLTADRVSCLSIDYNDRYILILEHETGHKGSLLVDVISRKPVRNLEVYSDDMYISWNGSPAGLMKYDVENKTDKVVACYNDGVDRLQSYAPFVIENAYKEEIVTFLNMINGRGEAQYSFDDDLIVLNLIDRIEAEAGR